MAKNKAELTADVERVLDVIRGGLAMHGGNVEVIDVEPDMGRVSVRFQGACVGCPMSEMTFKAGIEDTLLEMLPGDIKEVVQVA
jgi:Fe-S cluster biogenesis protein NfuA